MSDYFNTYLYHKQKYIILKNGCCQLSGGGFSYSDLLQYIDINKKKYSIISQNESTIRVKSLFDNKEIEFNLLSNNQYNKENKLFEIDCVNPSDNTFKYETYWDTPNINILDISIPPNPTIDQSIFNDKVQSCIDYSAPNEYAKMNLVKKVFNNQYQRTRAGNNDVVRFISLDILNEVNNLVIYDISYIDNHPGRLGNLLFHVAHLIAYALHHQKIYPTDQVFLNISSINTHVEEGMFKDIFKILEDHSYHMDIFNRINALPFNLMEFIHNKIGSVDLWNSNIVLKNEKTKSRYTNLRNKYNSTFIPSGTKSLPIVDSIDELVENPSRLYYTFNTLLIDQYREKIIKLLKNINIVESIKQKYKLKYQDNESVIINYRQGDFGGYSANEMTGYPLKEAGIDNCRKSKGKCFFPVVHFYAIYNIIKQEHYNEVYLTSAPGDIYALRCLKKYIRAYIPDINIIIPFDDLIDYVPFMATDYHEMLFVSLFKNKILSNGTFSFWCGYMSNLEESNKTFIFDQSYELTYAHDLGNMSYVFETEHLIKNGWVFISDYELFNCTNSGMFFNSCCDSDKCIGYKEQLVLISSLTDKEYKFKFTYVSEKNYPDGYDTKKIQDRFTNVHQIVNHYYHMLLDKVDKDHIINFLWNWMNNIEVYEDQQIRDIVFNEIARDIVSNDTKIKKTPDFNPWT